MKSDKETNSFPKTAEKASIWELGGLSWRQLAWALWQEIYSGSLLTHAAALSFRCSKSVRIAASAPYASPISMKSQRPHSP